MQAKKRYLLAVTCVAFLGICYFGAFNPWRRAAAPVARSSLVSFRAGWGRRPVPPDPGPGARRRQRAAAAPAARHCRMATCFDLARCAGRPFRVYVYPVDEAAPPSRAYRRVLDVIRESRLATEDPAAACLFVLALDTLDRDQLSSDFVHQLDQRVHALPLWNNGRNHLVFNLFSGTWPSYSEDVMFDMGEAILAKASMSEENFRQGFDVSLPLFPKKHPERGGEEGLVAAYNFPAIKKYLLAFKGKRYVYGIGSQTRNSLYHLHNGQDVVMATTCKHGKSWREMQDERCDEDNAEFDRYDYDTLLQNSTFCLVPRGRRVGSFRFLEVLQAGCVPVLLANGWRLPFDDVIDWRRAAVWGDERLLLQTTETVRSLDADRLLQLRQNTQHLWNAYFSSVERIVLTTLRIIESRVHTHLASPGTVWMNSPGSLFHLPTPSGSLRDVPLYRAPADLVPRDNFTAVILCQHGSPAPLYRLIKQVGASSFVSGVLLVWIAEAEAPTPQRLPRLAVPLRVITPERRTISARFVPAPQIHTDAVLSLDEDVTLITDELDFLYQVWRTFPERIVGFPARSHYWDDAKGTWGYTSKWLNDYSMVLTSAAMYHRYYHRLYNDWASDVLHKTVNQAHNCEDILMNFIVSHTTRRPPIKVTQRKGYKETTGGQMRPPWSDQEHFLQRHSCLNTFAAVFGYMPLLRSAARLDPVLFRDPVAVWRKRYSRLESAQAP
ncbi:exostosin-1-like [Pollicipes pollicipes]|uniref:exostosin-1-like n=1 Tax=Pollicipes pollicipes TaxID=41117 RepID=UPI00188519A7|nr:exostosin-1-like [Pollicipes pollicipes]XP_037081931.1 exostosin-1-like [Pollicipes pollicipes]